VKENMSAYAITGKITCKNGEIVPLTGRQQTIIANLARKFKDRSEVVAVLEHWEQKLPDGATSHQISEHMESILRPKQDIWSDPFPSVLTAA
jgi:hypothetical protein